MESSSQSQCLFKKMQEIEANARQFGFYWEHIDQLLEQIRSECVEIEEAWQKNDRPHLQEEIGDLLQAAISLAIFCDLDPRETLLKSMEKFENRYNKVVELARRDGYENLRQQSFEILLSYWKRAKNSSSDFEQS